MHSTRRVSLAHATLFYVCAVLPLLVSSAAADDLNPPDYRGEFRSTSAEWDFLTDQDVENIQPDGTSVPLIIGDFASELNSAFPMGAPHPSGTAFGDISYVDMSNGGYMAGTSGGSGLAFNVPNWIDQEPVKFLRIQVTYKGPAPSTRVFGFLGVPGTQDGVDVSFVERVTDDSPSLPTDTSYFYDDWVIFPNPDWEQVVIDMPPGTFVDQVVIDTISTVPEPASALLGMLALCWLGLMRPNCVNR